MKIGIICPSEIAIRRFMPALQNVKNFEFTGVGVCSSYERFGKHLPENYVVESVLKSEYKKAKEFVDKYGGKIYDGYETIVTSDEIEAIYIPLPPALHYKWAKKALESGKHVLLEKPSTTSAVDSADLVTIARKKGLALHENYMFIFHSQLEAIKTIIDNGEIGDVRLYRISFGFPMRAVNDFRYNKALGGGALIDAGGYTIKYAVSLLGKTAKIRFAQMNYLNDFEVDMYGSAVLTNEDGVTVQVSYGMDNNYKCELEVWGNRGCLTTGRILTAPAGFIPQVTIRKENKEVIRDLPADDAFSKSIKYFVNCINDLEYRENNYSAIVEQAKLVDQFRVIALKDKE